MAKPPSKAGILDREAYTQASEHFEYVRGVLPETAVERLAQEVVRRLAFRMPKLHRGGQMPHGAEIDRFCAALLSSDEVAGDRVILSAQQDGASPETIYLGYIAGAARKLGDMWVADELSFMQVTLACGRLYRIIRGLRHVLEETLVSQTEARHVLFGLVPGDNHTLGIEMATDLFRRDGWDVDKFMGDNADALIEMTENARYQSVVLVANSERMLAQLIRLVLAVRITQPMAHIVVAGGIAAQVPDVDRLVGADAVMHDLDTAIAQLRRIIDEGARD